MADLQHNISKGRFMEWLERSRTGADANGALVIAPFNSTGASTDDQVRDADTLAAIEALTGIDERTTGGWNRKTISDAAITITIDDTNDRVDADIADPVWPGVTTGTVTDLEFAYDSDTTAGTDSNILPGTWHDFAITPDGSDVTATIPTGGFARAQ